MRYAAVLLQVIRVHRVHHEAGCEYVDARLAHAHRFNETKAVGILRGGWGGAAHMNMAMVTSSMGTKQRPTTLQYGHASRRCSGGSAGGYLGPCAYSILSPNTSAVPLVPESSDGELKEAMDGTN